MSVAEERVARSVALEKAYVHDVYEQFSDGPRGRPWPKVNQFIADLEPGSLVCDVGCGNGKYLDSNPSVFNIGADKCIRLTKVAREKEKEVIVCDNLALPFRDESFDAVLSVAVVHHFATTERRVCALRELARILRIGGRLIISVWAMEQTHRKFESQDVLVPWHRPQTLSTPSLELTSTTNTSEEDVLPPYHAYTQTSDSDSNKSTRTKTGLRKRGRTRHKGRSIDPNRSSSPSSSSLSSPNETCYSFVRRAIQKLAGSKRSGTSHRPWFLETWNSCTKEPTQKRYDPDGCESYDCGNIQDLPIELRRVDDDEVPQRRQTFPSSQIIIGNDLYTGGVKSKSLTDIKTFEDRLIVRSQSSHPSLLLEEESGEKIEPVLVESTKSLNKPRLVKQKQSICDEDAEEALDKPTDMRNLVNALPEFRVQNGNTRNRGSVCKQQSMNEELMSTDRLREKERVKRNIQKQASLNEELIYQRHTLDSLRDSFFSVSTSKRFQLIKSGFTNTIKNSTNNIEKVAGSSLKNGFVRMFQNWKSNELIISPTQPTTPEVDPQAPAKPEISSNNSEEKIERRPSKEDGSDSSKDSSLQSDTSVDSEDSFASVIFVPKATDPLSPTPLSPGPTSPRLKTQQSVPNSPRIKQNSCPTSPRIKQMPLTVYPLTKQLSSPKPAPNSSPETPKLIITPIIVAAPPPPDTPKEEELISPKLEEKCVDLKLLKQKYSVVRIPKFRKPEPTRAEDKKRTERLRQIRELLNQRPGFGIRASRSAFPIVRHSSVKSGGRLEAIARPLPRLLSLELFNPETDDKDSDSSGVSSPDSVDSVINITEEIPERKTSPTKFAFPPESPKKLAVLPPKLSPASLSLLEAAADVAQSLDDAVETVIKSSSPRVKKKLLDDVKIESTWDEECHKHLTDFADKLSEKLLLEIDQYQEQSRKEETKRFSPYQHINDPYIHRLSEELNDLNKLSAEIQKQNQYLSQLSKNDLIQQIDQSCFKCKTKHSSDTTTTNNKSDKVPYFKSKCAETSDEQGLIIKDNLVNIKDVEIEELKYNRLSRESSDASRSSLLLQHSVDSETADLSLSSDKDTNSVSKYSDCGSTASINSKSSRIHHLPNRSVSQDTKLTDNSSLNGGNLNASLSDTSQDSLPSDNIGGAITYHRYYHVFREGELDQLIERYVENLHIISSYYDHASWCVVAEKVQVWTI